MSMQARGGIPRQFNAAITDAGRYHQFPSLTISVRVVTDAAVHLYFTEDDFTNDTNRLELAANEVYDGPAEVRGLWFKAPAATTANVKVTSYHRKG